MPADLEQIGLGAFPGWNVPRRSLYRQNTHNLSHKGEDGKGFVIGCCVSWVWPGSYMIRGLLALVRGPNIGSGISPLLSTGAADIWTQIDLANATDAGAGLGLSFKEFG